MRRPLWWALGAVAFVVVEALSRVAPEGQAREIAWLADEAAAEVAALIFDQAEEAFRA